MAWNEALISLVALWAVLALAGAALWPAQKHNARLYRENYSEWVRLQAESYRNGGMGGVPPGFVPWGLVGVGVAATFILCAVTAAIHGLPWQ